MEKLVRIEVTPRERPLRAPIYPVWNVESPVRSQSGKVMSRDGLRLTCPLQQEQLWENGDGLEEDGE